MGYLVVLSKMHISFDMAGVTRFGFQAARSHAHHEQGELDAYFDMNA